MRVISIAVHTSRPWNAARSTGPLQSSALAINRLASTACTCIRRSPGCSSRLRGRRACSRPRLAPAPAALAHALRRRAAAGPALYSNDLIVEGAEIEAQRRPVCEVVLERDGAGGALGRVDWDVLVEGGGADDGGLVYALVFVDGVGWAVEGYGAFDGTEGGGRAVRFDDVVFNEGEVVQP